MTVPPQGTPPAVESYETGLIYHLDAADLEAQLRTDAIRGLTAERKSLPSKWFYDARGSQLFDRITRLPEYYLTRSERAILEDRAGLIAGHTEGETLVELGSGTSEKTRLLLDACCGCGRLRRFVPFDVDAATLAMAAGDLMGCYAGIEVLGIVGDFEKHLAAVEQPGRTVVAFLGSTIGNLDAAQRAVFLRELSSSLKPGDFFLVGVDLVKDLDRLHAAYNDSAGVTAEFNLNILRVMNRRLEGDFDLASFEHLAEFNAAEERIEMWLRSTRRQSVTLKAVDLRVDFDEGELLHTEISCKFRPERFEGELRDAGLEPAYWWTDPDRNFALSLSCKP